MQAAAFVIGSSTISLFSSQSNQIHFPYVALVWYYIVSCELGVSWSLLISIFVGVMTDDDDDDAGLMPFSLLLLFEFISAIKLLVLK